MDSSLARRTIVCHARPEAFNLSTASILARLGYELCFSEDWEERPEEERADAPPALRIVDERRLAEVDDVPGEERTPIILLTGRHGASGADSRVVAAVKRPAGLHDLFRVLQQLLEETPRSTPRVPTHLRAICSRKGLVWDGAILSLSENGCLLRSPRPLPLGTQLLVRFELPGTGALALEADTAYQLLPDTGLVFNATPPGQRAAIQSFVESALR